MIRIQNFMKLALCFLSFLVFSQIAISNVQEGIEPLPHKANSIISYGPDISFWLIILLLVAVFSLIFLVALYKKYGGKDKDQEVFVDRPLEIYKSLSNLKPEEPFLKKAQENFFHELGFSLRHYIELKTKLSATDQTFKELKEPLRKEFEDLGLEPSNMILFLEKSEYIKFADKMTSLEEAISYRKDVIVWLDDLNRALENKKKQEESSKKGASSL